MEKIRIDIQPDITKLSSELLHLAFPGVFNKKQMLYVVEHDLNVYYLMMNLKILPGDNIHTVIKCLNLKEIQILKSISISYVMN